MFLNRLVLYPYLIRRYTDAKIMKLFRIRDFEMLKMQEAAFLSVKIWWF